MSIPSGIRALHITGPDRYEMVAKPLPQLLTGSVETPPCSAVS